MFLIMTLNSELWVFTIHYSYIIYYFDGVTVDTYFIQCACAYSYIDISNLKSIKRHTTIVIIYLVRVYNKSLFSKFVICFQK